MRTIILISLSCRILFSCASNKPTNSNNLTLGVVQSKIYKGQSQSKVLEILGSPNIVTNDDGKEIWTYDRISKENTGSSNAGFYMLNPFYWIFGGGTFNRSSSNESSKSLTVIITFDENKNVLDFTYQSLKY